MVNDRLQKKALCVWIQLLWERASLGWSSLHPLTLTEDSHNRSQEKDKIYHKLKQSPKKESHNMPQICVNKKYMLVKERHQTGTQEGGLTEFFSEKAKAIKTQNLCPVICNKSLKQNCADSQKKKWKVTLRLSLREKTKHLSWPIAKKGEESILCLSISWFNVSHHHQRQLGSVSVVWEKHFAVI